MISESSSFMKNLVIRKAFSEKDLIRAKLLDDEVFGTFQGISLDQLREIYINGHVILMFNDKTESVLLAESQVIYSSISSDINVTFLENESYIYGTGVHKDYQGNGLAKYMAIKQEEFSIQAGKNTLVGTVRVENYPSLKLRLNLGYQIVGYDPFFYGFNQGLDSRLKIKKQILPSKKNIVWKKRVELIVTHGPNFDFFDEDAHLKIAKLISLNFVGFDVIKLDNSRMVLLFGLI